MSNHEFAGRAMTLDGVSISDEGDLYVCTCEEQSEGKIDVTPVFDAAHTADLPIFSTVADFEAGHVRVAVAKEREE